MDCQVCPLNERTVGRAAQKPPPPNAAPTPWFLMKVIVGRVTTRHDGASLPGRVRAQGRGPLNGSSAGPTLLQNANLWDRKSPAMINNIIVVTFLIKLLCYVIVRLELVELKADRFDAGSGRRGSLQE